MTKFKVPMLAGMHIEFRAYLLEARDTAYRKSCIVW